MEYEHKNKTEKEFESLIKYNFKIKIPLIKLRNFARKLVTLHNMKKKEKYKEIEPLTEPTDGEEKDKNPMPKPPPIK